MAKACVVFGEVIKVIIAIVIPNAGGALGALFFRPDDDGWYEDLNFPPFRPPNFLFLPVWTILYTAMGVASYLVYRNGGGFTGNAQVPLVVYSLQLILNWAWTPVFFGMRNILGGLMEIIAVTTSVTICFVLFIKINRPAGLLFLPYIAWVSFATYLNYTLFVLNPSQSFNHTAIYSISYS